MKASGMTSVVVQAVWSLTRRNYCRNRQQATEHGRSGVAVVWVDGQRGLLPPISHVMFAAPEGCVACWQCQPSVSARSGLAMALTWGLGGRTTVLAIHGAGRDC